MNALCLYIFDVSRSKPVKHKFYDKCVTSGEDCSKADSSFEAMNQCFIKDGIDWEYAVSIGLGNTNTNVGNNNSIKTRIHKKKNEWFIAGCNCHLCHLAAGAGGKAFAKEDSFEIDEHQVDLYYFFKSSSKRKGILVEYLNFVNLKWENMVRYVKTRWLSLKCCYDKKLRKFPALKSIFLSIVHGRLGIMVSV